MLRFAIVSSIYVAEVLTVDAYESRRANLIEGLKMQVRLGNWVKVAELAIDLRVLEAKEAGKPLEG